MIKKFTKLVMKRLYGEDVLVFFDDNMKSLRAIFRDKCLPPYSMKNFEEWRQKPACSITFNGILYNTKDSES